MGQWKPDRLVQGRQRQIVAGSLRGSIEAKKTCMPEQTEGMGRQVAKEQSRMSRQKRSREETAYSLSRK